MPTPEASKAARDAVEALPSHLFDRAHTEEIAANLAPDFDRFAAQRGAEADRLVHLFAKVIVEGDGAFTGREWEAALCEAERIDPFQPVSEEGLAETRKQVDKMMDDVFGPVPEGAPPQTGGGDAGEAAEEYTPEEIAAILERHGREAAIAAHQKYGMGGGDVLREAVRNLIIQYERCSLADFVSALELEMQAVRSAYGSISGDLLITPKSRQAGGGDAAEQAREHASAVLYRVTEHLAKTGEWAEEDIEALRAGLAMLDCRKADLRSSHREGAEAMREVIVRWHEHYAGMHRPGIERNWHKASSLHHSALPIPWSKTDAG